MNPAAKVSVLVTDGEQNAALAVVRSLGRAGYCVYVCSGRAHSLAGASRYARAHATVADPLREPEHYVADVQTLVRKWNAAVLLPISEASLLAVLSQRGAFGDVVIPFPELLDFQRACDKVGVAQLASRLGVHVPAQRVLEQPLSLSDCEALPVPFPLVVKPARSVSGSATLRRKHGVKHASSPATLRSVLDALPAEAFPVMLQERIVGHGMGVFLLRWENEIRATFCHRRIREKPPSGGVSVYSESVAPNRRLIALSAALLQALNWNGVAMVEYKLDAATGRPFLMEINGRFWGSLQLAIDAGVDFPALLLSHALGQATAVVEKYRVGVRTRWWWGDVDHLLARLRRSREELALPPDAPGLGRAIRDFVSAFARPHRGMVFRPHDPAPAMRETLDWFHAR